MGSILMKMKNTNKTMRITSRVMSTITLPMKLGGTASGSTSIPLTIVTARPAAPLSRAHSLALPAFERQ